MTPWDADEREMLELLERLTRVGESSGRRSSGVSIVFDEEAADALEDEILYHPGAWTREEELEAERALCRLHARVTYGRGELGASVYAAALDRMWACVWSQTASPDPVGVHIEILQRSAPDSEPVWLRVGRLPSSGWVR